MLCDKKHSHVQWRDFKMNVLICDDDQQIVDSIIEELKKKSEETHVALRFYGFSQPSQIDLSLPYDIALLDIDMGETNGIELARKLRAENENIVIIFITNFIQYAPEGFEVQAFRYLLKADFSAKLDSYFDSAVQEVLQRKQLVTISINSEIIDVPVNDILYLESHRRIIVMHLLDEKRPAYQFYGNITELSEKIEPLGFLRIQKSYLVNMHYVEIFQYNKVQLRGGLCLAPSENSYEKLLACAGQMVELVSGAVRIPETAFNVIAQKDSRTKDRIVITAHIDTKIGTPGAIDNATGVTAVLLLAELLKDSEDRKSVV